MNTYTVIIRDESDALVASLRISGLDLKANRPDGPDFVISNVYDVLFRGTKTQADTRRVEWVAYPGSDGYPAPAR